MSKKLIYRNWKIFGFVLFCCIFSRKFSYSGNFKINLLPDDFLEKNNSGSCQSAHSIYYVRIPKTGSSTMSSIIQRMAYQNNLTVPVLYNYDTKEIVRTIRPFAHLFPHPIDMENILKNNDKFALNILLEKQNYHPVNKFDVYTDHSILNYEEIMKYFKKDVKIISTCRHPLKRVISYVNYKPDILKIPKGENPTDFFFSNIKKFRKFTTQLNNVMATFLGFAPLNERNDIDDHIQFLGQIIDHVVITEKFYESLVLLRRKFCWDMKSILHLNFKTRNYEIKDNETKLNEYKEKYKDKINHITKYDYKIYNYFLKQHEEFKKKEGIESVEREVEIYHKVNTKIAEFCLNLCQGIYNETKTLNILPSEFNHAFSVSNYDCILMYLPGNSYNNLIMEKEYQELCLNHYFKDRYPSLCPTLKTLKYRYIKDCKGLE